MPKDQLFDRESLLRQVLDSAAGFGELPDRAMLAQLSTDDEQRETIRDMAEECAQMRESGNLGHARKWAAECTARFSDYCGELATPHVPDERSIPEIVDRISRAGHAVPGR
jgi:hypothetical protein